MSLLPESGRLLEPVELVEASLGVTDDGGPAVIAIYDHPYNDGRFGLRFRLGQYPLSVYEGMPVAVAAQDPVLARFEERLVDHAFSPARRIELLADLRPRADVILFESVALAAVRR